MIDPIARSILDINNQVPLFAAKIPDNDLNRDTYTWGAENNNYAYFPTARFDYFITPNNSSSGRGTIATTGRPARGVCR